MKIHKINNNCIFKIKPYMNMLTLLILGGLSWGVAFCAWGEGWKWNGPWFRLAAVAVLAWLASYICNSLLGLPGLLAALYVGILVRNLGYLNMMQYAHIDSFLRKIYPVIILGKASLGWDVNFMKKHWRRVFTLGVLPWSLEVLILAFCVHYLLNFPLIWGLLLGSIYASVSCAVVLPSVNKHKDTSSSDRNWSQLVCTAGGVDTALSVGVYGLIFSFIFSESNQTYRITKAVLTLFVGIVLGIGWGSLAKYLPHKDDYFVTELRVLFLLLGGLFGNFFTSHIGWSGAGGVAVLICNATAATHWAKQGWKLNNNPASTAYRVVWAILEPILFAYTGTFFLFDRPTLNTLLYGFGILALCLAARLMMTAIVCWDFKLKEKIYICCTWIPKSIVEAVLCPVALEAVLSANSYELSSDKLQHAQDMIRLTVQLITLTTPLGYLLTEYLGPRLLKTSMHTSEIDK